MHALILDLLRDQPLRFNEIKRHFEAKYSRKIADNVLYENLEALLKAHLVERVLDDEGKVRYRVTSEYYKKEVVEKLRTFISEASGNRNFEFEYQFRSHIAPLVSMMESSENPAQKLDWELEQHGVVIFNLFEPIRNFLEAEDRIRQTLFEFAHSPAEAIAYNMYRWLDSDSKIKIARFLAWAYWAGLQNHRVRDDLEESMFRLKSTIEGQRLLALRSKEAGEKALKILGYIKEAYSKPNLKELLEYLFSKKKEVEMFMHEIFEKEGDTSICNSDFFNRLFAFHDIILSGLCCAFPGKQWAGEEVLWLYNKVWSRFAMLVFIDTPDVLAEVSGDLDRAIRTVRENADALDILIALPKKCRCILVYLFGYDDILRLADKSVVLRIDEWINELKRGQLDHRTYIFYEGRTLVEKICRALIRGRPPPKEKIDSSEMWTAYDLYMHHPRGKDPNFWIQEILETMRKRISLGLPGPPEEQKSVQP